MPTRVLTRYPRVSFFVFAMGSLVLLIVLIVLIGKVNRLEAERNATADSARARCFESRPVFSAVQNWMSALLEERVANGAPSPELDRLVETQQVMLMAFRVPTVAECEKRRLAVLNEG